MSGALAARFMGLMDNRWGRIALALLAGLGVADPYAADDEA